MWSFGRHPSWAVSFAALTLSLSVAAQSSQQLLPQVGVRGLVPSPLVTIGDGQTSKGRFNGTTEQPFAAAVAALPSGGTILVGQGVYQFSSPISISTDGIEIVSSGATLHSSQDPTSGLFLVTGSDFRLEGLTLRDDQPSTGHALIDAHSPGFHARDCSFIGGEAVTVTPIFVRVQFPDTKTGGLWVESNLFLPARGWTLVDVVNVRNAQLNSNRISFVEDGIESSAEMLYGFRGLNLSHGEIRGNTFDKLGSMDHPVESLIYLENQGVEAHHMVIAGNLAHAIMGRRVLHLRGSQFNVVEANSIGRIVGSSVIAAIDIEDNSDGVASRYNTIVGNDMHNVLNAPCIRINGGSGCLISGNLFSVISSTCVVVGSSSTTTNVSILSNQFLDGSTTPGYPAVSITGGSGQAVIGNTFRDFGPGAAQVTGVPSGQFQVSGNFEM